VLLVQPRRGGRGNKELTPVRPRSGVGHTQHIRPIVLQIATELVFKLFSPYTFTSDTVSEGVPGLDHEFGNDAVEDYAFEVSTSRVTGEVLDRQRGLLREQPEADVTERPVALRSRGDGLGRCEVADDAIVCSSCVGRSLKRSRS